MDVTEDNQDDGESETSTGFLIEPIEPSSASINAKNSNNSKIVSKSSNASSIISKNIEPLNSEVNLKDDEVIEVENKDVKNTSEGSDNSLFYNALQKIDDIIREAELLRQQVENFSGSSTDDRDYIYLEEMLIRSTLRLDNIDVGGDENIKQQRKKAIQYIQKLMKILDIRLKENQKSIKYYKAYESDDD